MATGWKPAWLQSLRACPWHETCCTPQPARLALPRSLAPQLCLWAEPGTEWDGTWLLCSSLHWGGHLCSAGTMVGVGTGQFSKGRGWSALCEPQLVSQCQGTSICSQLPLPYL